MKLSVGGVRLGRDAIAPGDRAAAAAIDQAEADADMMERDLLVGRVWQSATSPRSIASAAQTP